MVAPGLADPVGGHLYRLHDLLRVYAREQLVDAELPQDRRAAAERLLGEYCASAWTPRRS